MLKKVNRNINKEEERRREVKRGWVLTNKSKKKVNKIYLIKYIILK